MIVATPLAASLFSIGAGAVRSIVDTMLSEVTRWVAAGAGSVLEALGTVLTSTTTPDLGRGFLGEYATMSAVSAALALPLLLLAVVRAVVQQDLGELLRAALLRLPVALLMAGAAVGLVSLALQAADALSGALLAVAGHPVDGFIASLVTGLAAASSVAVGPGAAVVGGFAALLLALLATAVAFLLWVELVVRSAAVAAATLFLPLALAGLVWPATAHWARRLAETIFALVLSKVVVAGVLALAGVSITAGNGVPGAVEGVALLFLATFAPFTVLRLVPMIEGGAIAHLDGTGRRPLAAAARAGGLVAGIDTGAGGGSMASAAGDVGGASGSVIAGTGPRGPGGAPGGALAVLDDVPGAIVPDLSRQEIRDDAARRTAAAAAVRERDGESS
ncbi:MAG TPA: hypothetical protein VND23_08350 [Acidimicrobiales bacterium]|nr:hypothetical protein [Acidimicrobiales bacterium]